MVAVDVSFVWSALKKNIMDIEVIKHPGETTGGGNNDLEGLGEDRMSVGFVIILALNL
jgi:hypothetical protein